MNELLVFLKNRDVLTIREIYSYFSEFRVLANEFVDSMEPGGPESESPEEVAIIPTPKSILLTNIAEFTATLKDYEEALMLPRKFVETEEMVEMNSSRVLSFGMIKRTINLAYKNNRNDLDAQKLWYLIRIYKNFGNLKPAGVTTSITKFISEMESDAYKACAEALDLKALIDSLKKKNDLYVSLLMKRSDMVKKNYKSVGPYRKESTKAYLKLVNLINGFIQLSPFIDLSESIRKLNGHTDYYNNLIYQKLTRRETKNSKNKPDPINPEPETPAT